MVQGEKEKKRQAENEMRRQYPRIARHEVEQCVDRVLEQEEMKEAGCHGQPNWETKMMMMIMIMKNMQGIDHGVKWK